MKRVLCTVLCFIFAVSLGLEGFAAPALADIPAYAGMPYAEINGGVPFFTEEEKTAEAFEYYAPQDTLGRCTQAFACVGHELMPTEERGAIGSIKPSGWHTVKYDIVDGKYLYNRCHLIGYQLTAENANECNLITGTRYLNMDGMLPFENLTAGYIEREFEKGNPVHVLYRVTPLYDGDCLVAAGVLMEGLSVEDDARGVCFCVFCYNVQPGIEINYATGESRLTPGQKETTGKTYETVLPVTFVINEASLKFHLPSCASAKKISAENRREASSFAFALMEDGYSPCGVCHPEKAEGTVVRYYYGDADLDGSITAADARLVLRTSVGLEQPGELALILSDTDADGTVSAADARTVLRAAVGLDPAA